MENLIEMSIVALTCSLLLQQEPVVFPETTLTEVSAALASHGIQVDVGNSIRNRTIYVHFESKPGVGWVHGLAANLNLREEFSVTTRRWKLTARSDELPLHRMRRSAITSDLRTFLQIAQEYQGATSEQLEKLLAEASKGKPAGVTDHDKNDAARMRMLAILFSRAKDSQNLLRQLNQLGPDALAAALLDQSGPAAAFYLKGNADLEAEVFAQFARLTGNVEPKGEPMYVIASELRPDQYTFRLCAVFANTSIILESLILPRKKEVQQRAPSFPANLAAKIVVSPASACPNIAGTSLEILPAVSAQMGVSFASWCPATSAVWLDLPSTFRVSDLQSTFPSSEVLSVRYPHFASALESSSHSIMFFGDQEWLSALVQADCYAGGDVNFTKVLPLLRKYRSRGIVIDDLVTFAHLLTIDECIQLGNVARDRPLLPINELRLLESIPLVKAATMLQNDSALVANCYCQQRIGELPADCKKLLLGFLRADRQWVSRKYLWHPAFLDESSSLTLLIRTHRIGNQMYLEAGIPEKRDLEWVLDVSLSKP